VFHFRVESFVLARDHYLRPGGHIFPSTGSIHLAPFSDAQLWHETKNKARWWQQDNFFGYLLFYSCYSVIFIQFYYLHFCYILALP
jgi:hypothetical protein